MGSSSGRLVDLVHWESAIGRMVSVAGGEAVRTSHLRKQPTRGESALLLRAVRYLVPLFGSDSEAFWRQHCTWSLTANGVE